MANKLSRGPWRVVKSRREGWSYEIRNGHRDPVAVIYTSESDARLLGAGLRMLGELKHAEAILRMREPTLRASEKATLARIRALIAEVSA